MSRRARLALAACASVLVGACGTTPREPIPITPPAEVSAAPVARVPVAPSAPRVPGAPVPAQKLDPATLPPGAIYVCASGSGPERKVTAIGFDEKVGALCRRHPEMGPCQYERNLCRKSGGRVFAADGNEITLATEDEYDRKVMRVRFRSN